MGFMAWLVEKQIFTEVCYNQQNYTYSYVVLDYYIYFVSLHFMEINP